MAFSDRSARSQVALAANLMLGQQNMNILTNIHNLVIVILGFASCTVEMFTSREFGSRYLNLLRIIAAWQVMRIYCFFLNLPEIVNLRLVYGEERTIHPWFMYSFLTLAGAHLLRNWIRERSGVVWHSQSSGLSWLSFLPIPGTVLFRFMEPACVIAVGWFLRSVDGPTGGWLVFAGIALFVRNNMIHNAMRDRLLDVIDAQIEARYMNEAQSGKPKQQTAGWEVVPIPVGDLFNDGEPLDIRTTVRETMGTDGYAARVQEG